MLGKIIAKLTIFALRNKRLTGEPRTRVMNELLNNLNAIQYKKIIDFDETGAILLNGRNLTYEQAVNFREGCKALVDNEARKVITAQIGYEAVRLGVHNGLNPEMIQFSKAAIWCKEQEDLLIAHIISG